jgi:hypothetical protein
MREHEARSAFAAKLGARSLAMLGCQAGVLEEL